MAELHGRKPLFPGEDYIQQMSLIFNVLGTPQEEDMKFITNQKAYQFIRGLPPRPPTPLQDLYRRANPLAMDLLTKMLTFNPQKRISVDEALAHPYLRGLHNAALETECNRPFGFAFERIRMTKPVLQAFMMEEICEFRPSLREAPSIQPYLKDAEEFYSEIYGGDDKMEQEYTGGEDMVFQDDNAMDIQGEGEEVEEYSRMVE